jgi:hypothetical protein
MSRCIDDPLVNIYYQCPSVRSSILSVCLSVCNLLWLRVIVKEWAINITINPNPVLLVTPIKRDNIIELLIFIFVKDHLSVGLIKREMEVPHTEIIRCSSQTLFLMADDMKPILVCSFKGSVGFVRRGRQFCLPLSLNRKGDSTCLNDATTYCQ